MQQATPEEEPNSGHRAVRLLVDTWSTIQIVSQRDSTTRNGGCSSGGVPVYLYAQREQSATTTQNQAETCHERMDKYGDHAVLCEKGPWRVRRHDQVADYMSELLRSSGAITIREFPFLELRCDERDAILDIWATGSAWMGDVVIDVTVRHPCSADLLRAAAETDGACAMDAERDKQKRYPPSAGIRVTTLAAETFGRLGPEAEELLANAAAATVRRNQSRGLPAGRPLQRWRAAISAFVAKSVARTIRSAKQVAPDIAPSQRQPSLPSSAVQPG